MTCPYITSLERECGRDAPPGQWGFCPLHVWLYQLDSLKCFEDLEFSSWDNTPELDRIRTRLITRIGELK